MPNQKKPANKGLIISICVLVVLLAAASALYFTHPAKPLQGAKTLTIAIYHGETLARTVELHTDAATLRAALDEQQLIAGEDSAYGLFVQTVDGTDADANAQQWWRFTKGGEMVETGVDDTYIADGDTFEITLMTGY